MILITFDRSSSITLVIIIMMTLNGVKWGYCIIGKYIILIFWRDIISSWGWETSILENPQVLVGDIMGMVKVKTRYTSELQCNFEIGCVSQPSYRMGYVA